MSPSFVQRRSSRRSPSTEDCYRADKALSQQFSLRERILRFFCTPAPKITSNRSVSDRKDSLELAVRAYQASKPRFWTDVYDHYAVPSQPAPTGQAYRSTYGSHHEIRHAQQPVQHEESIGRRQNSTRGDEGGDRWVDKERLPSLIGNERGTEVHGDTSQRHGGAETDHKPRTKKRVRFAV